MPAIVRKVVKVEDHPVPEKSHLGVYTLSNGAVCIGVNPSEGVRRFQVDDFVVHVEPGSKVPEWMMNNGFENLRKDKGKVKASNFAGVRSEGIMLNVIRNEEDGWHDVCIQGEYEQKMISEGDDLTLINEAAIDCDVSSCLGIVD